jgi:hypothetical protein
MSMSVSTAAQYTVHALSRSAGETAAQSECASRHVASVKKDDVWTQFYPLLDN